MGYLVISRQINERIKIGDDITIMISDIHKNGLGQPRVDIAIDAPRHLKINRQMTHMEEDQASGNPVRNKPRPRD